MSPRRPVAPRPRAEETPALEPARAEPGTAAEVEPTAADETSDRRPRSPLTVAFGSFLVLAAGALVAVIAVGDSAPLWLVGGWMLLAVAISLVIGSLVPSGRSGAPRR